MSDAAKKGRGIAPFRFDESPPITPATSSPTAVAEPHPKAARPPSRRGKRNVNFVLSEPAWEQLSILSVRTRRPIQDLMQEATDLLFQANSLSRIARE
jgi:hypothetical protein